MRNRDTRNARRQQGAILIISLLLLMVLTIIGVAGIQSTTLEERMSSNLREQYYAFQAAEAGMREAELIIEGLYNRSVFNNTLGLYTRDNDLIPDPHDYTVWDPALKKVVEIESLTDLQLKGHNPAYFVEEIGIVESKGADLDLGGGYTGGSSGDVYAFRVVVRGEGPNGTGQALLQSHYGKLF